MPGSVEAFIVISVFLVPGYIMMLVNSWLSAPRWPSGYTLVMNMVVFGLLNSLVALVVVSPWWECLRAELVPMTRTDGYQSTCGLQWILLAGVAFALCFVLPAVLGVGLAAVRNKGWIKAVDRWLVPLLGGRTREEAWDTLFDRPEDEPLWVHAYLKDGVTVYEGLTYHVTEHPSEKALILTDVRVRRDTGDWEELEAAYILLSGENIRALEAYE